MPIFSEPLPLSLYIHLPWCVQKCPYCDFNSHALKNNLPEEAYVGALLTDLDQQVIHLDDRKLISIFFGGGTPSLFSGKAIGRILEHLNQINQLSAAIEITLEANPGTVEQKRFADFHAAGINRLSLGVQSFQDDKLKRLGRIHDSAQAKKAILAAQKAGFKRINIDLMYGLPEQTIEDAEQDLAEAIQCDTTHLSWYQLTLEPNTLFHHHPPTLPHDDTIWEMQQTGIAQLQAAGLKQYEVSAYAKKNDTCRHNVNYWEFGDYLGIGAGAHGKLTNIHTGDVKRTTNVKHPKLYLDSATLKQTIQLIPEDALIFEFMLNALRLTAGVPVELFTKRTGIPLSVMEPLLQQAITRGLLEPVETRICPTQLGKRFLNDLMSIFLGN